MKYKGIELKEVTEPQSFEPYRRWGAGKICKAHLQCFYTRGAYQETPTSKKDVLPFLPSSTARLAGMVTASIDKSGKT